MSSWLRYDRSLVIFTKDLRLGPQQRPQLLTYDSLDHISYSNTYYYILRVINKLLDNKDDFYKSLLRFFWITFEINKQDSS